MTSENKVRKTSLLLGIIAVVSFAIAFGFFFDKGWYSGSFKARAQYQNNIDQEEGFPPSGINSISISTTTADIYFISLPGDTIRAHFYGSINTDSKDKMPYLEVQKKGSALEVEIKRYPGINIGFILSRLRLDIELPSSFKNTVSARSVSGDVTIPELSLEDFFVKTVSGDVKLEQLQARNFNFGSTSGDITLRLPKESEFALSAKTISGDIECDFPLTLQSKIRKNRLNGFVVSDINTLKLKTTSGDIRIKPD